MNKSILMMVLAIGTFLSACSNNGNSVEANEAQDVKVVETETSSQYNVIDPTSHIEWRASHLGGVQPRFGKISPGQANISVTDGKVSNATILIKMASLTVENFGDDAESTSKLTGHLLSGDFFQVDAFGTSTFELVDIQSTEGDYNSKVTGNLTIKDVTKSISFNANVNVAGDVVSIKSEDFAVDRSDWGLTYHAEGDEGVPVDYLISDEIGFTIDVKVSK